MCSDVRAKKDDLVQEIEIIINAFRCQVHIGCTDEERSFARPVEIDISAKLDSPRCLMSDSLEDTFDYAAAVKAVEHLVAENSWNLLERFASDIGKTILELSSDLLEVNVVVSKNVFAQVGSVKARVSLRR